MQADKKKIETTKKIDNNATTTTTTTATTRHKQQLLSASMSNITGIAAWVYLQTKQNNRLGQDRVRQARETQSLRS